MTYFLDPISFEVYEVKANEDNKDNLVFYATISKENKFTIHSMHIQSFVGILNSKCPMTRISEIKIVPFDSIIEYIKHQNEPNSPLTSYTLDNVKYKTFCEEIEKLPTVSFKNAQLALKDKIFYLEAIEGLKSQNIDTQIKSIKLIIYLTVKKNHEIYQKLFGTNDIRDALINCLSFQNIKIRNYSIKAIAMLVQNNKDNQILFGTAKQMKNSLVKNLSLAYSKNDDTIKSTIILIRFLVANNQNSFILNDKKIKALLLFHLASSSLSTKYHAALTMSQLVNNQNDDKFTIYINEIKKQLLEKLSSNKFSDRNKSNFALKFYELTLIQTTEEKTILNSRVLIQLLENLQNIDHCDTIFNKIKDKLFVDYSIDQKFILNKDDLCKILKNLSEKQVKETFDKVKDDDNKYLTVTCSHTLILISRNLNKESIKRLLSVNQKRLFSEENLFKDQSKIEYLYNNNLKYKERIQKMPWYPSDVSDDNFLNCLLEKISESQLSTIKILNCNSLLFYLKTFNENMRKIFINNNKDNLIGKNKIIKNASELKSVGKYLENTYFELLGKICKNVEIAEKLTNDKNKELILEYLLNEFCENDINSNNYTKLLKPLLKSCLRVTSHHTNIFKYRSYTKSLTQSHKAIKKSFEEIKSKLNITDHEWNKVLKNNPKDIYNADFKTYKFLKNNLKSQNIDKVENNF